MFNSQNKSATSVQIFKSTQFGEVRTITENGEPLFVAADVCKSLCYAKPRNALQQHVESEDALKRGILTAGGMQQVTFINESGVYALIFGSKLPQAKQFKKWVTSDNDDVHLMNTPTTIGIQSMTFVTESGMYGKKIRKSKKNNEYTCIFKIMS